MQPVERERETARRQLRRVTGETRDDSTAAAAANAPPVARSSAIERCGRSGRSTQIASAAASRNSAKQIARSRKPRPNAESRMSGSRSPSANAERNANRDVARTRYTGIATSATPEAMPNAIVTDRRLVPSTRRTSGRTIAIRRTKSPIAVITARNATVRAATSPGVATVSETDGITNSGGGPGFGPTANVNAPRTGCPSTEITRQ